MTKETKVMSKEEAIQEVKRMFKGNKKFISYCEVVIASTSDFVGITNCTIEINNWNWEKFLSLNIKTNLGWKHVTYRKGNKKYSPENLRTNEGNATSELNEYIFTTYTHEKEQGESYTIQA